MKYFVVFQNKTFKEEHAQGILWAPKKNKSGGPATFHWKSMTDVKKGDIIFSIVKNIIVARGVATGSAIDQANPFDNDLWYRDGWLVKLNYEFPLEKMKISEHIEDLRALLPDYNSPFNKITGGGNQGYLFPISKELGQKLDEYITDVFESEDFDSVFDIDLETSNEIRHLYEEQGIEEGTLYLAETDRPDGTNKPKTRRQVIQGRKTDFLKKSQKDAKTGLLAEELVVAYEKEFLINNDKEYLANKVKWVAKEADGYGYDVLSYTLDGKIKYIEVKATTLGKTHPFDISLNEVRTSVEKKDNYWIYRVYYMDSNEPKFYTVNGNVIKKFYLEPTSYKAYIKEKETTE